MGDGRKLMDDKETSEYTGFSLWAINEMRRRGTIPHLKLPGIRKYYFEVSKIDIWLENLQTQSMQQANTAGLRQIR